MKEVKKVEKRPAHENLKANDKTKIKAFNTTKEKFLQLLPFSMPKPPLLRMLVPQLNSTLSLVTATASCPHAPRIFHAECGEQHVQPIEHVTITEGSNVL